WNITHMSASEHIRYHNAITFGPDFDSGEHSAAIRDGFRRLSEDPVWRERFAEAQRQRALEFWSNPRYADARNAVIQQRRNPSNETREAHRQAMVRRYSDPGERERQSQLMK